MCTFLVYIAFNKATNKQTDIKHEKDKKISWMSLLKIAPSLATIEFGKWRFEDSTDVARLMLIACLVAESRLDMTFAVRFNGH